MQTASSIGTGVFECPTHTSEARPTQQMPTPGHKRRHTSENCPTAVSSCGSNTPVKRKCPEAATTRISCKVVLTPKRHSNNVISDFVENRNPKRSRSDLGDPATCSIENKDSIQYISSFNEKTDALNTYMLQQHLCSAHSGSSDSMVKSKTSREHLNKPDCFQSETGNDPFPHMTAKNITSLTVYGNSKHVANTHQLSSRTSRVRIFS